MGAIFAVLSIPLMLLNAFGGIVSGIWLAFLGEWKLLGIGIVAILGSGLIVNIALIPGMILTLPGVFFLEKKWNIPGYFFVLLSTLYTTALIVVWCVGVLIFFMSKATAATYIPLLIWSYGIGVGVWTWLAQKDGNEASFVSSFFAQVGYVVMMVMVLVANRVTIIDLAYAFGGVMLLALIANFIMAVAAQRQARFQSY